MIALAEKTMPQTHSQTRRQMHKCSVCIRSGNWNALGKSSLVFAKPFIGWPLVPCWQENCPSPRHFHPSRVKRHQAIALLMCCLRTWWTEYAITSHIMCAKTGFIFYRNSESEEYFKGALQNACLPLLVVNVITKTVNTCISHMNTV